MMKQMNTGGVQYIELQPCNEQKEYDVRNYTHKVMPFEHYGESGTLHQWEKKGKETTSLLYHRLWLQRVSCVLVVLYQVFVSSLFLSCAAADNTIGILTNITDCFPHVLLYPSEPKYYCELENVTPLKGRTLSVGYYNDKPISVWKCSLAGKNLIEFQPNSPLPLRNPKLLILQPAVAPLFINVKLTNQFPMTYMNLQDTSASLTSKPAYYGLRATIQTNFPDTSATLHYRLVTSRSNCENIATSCTAAAGCHDLTTSPFLPVPWGYLVCLGRNGWRDHYLPWGTSLLDVGVLVSTTLYINSSGSEKFLLQDAVTGADVTNMKNVFLVMCPGSVCPLVTLTRGDQAVSVDVCTGSTQGDRVYLPTGGGSFSATSGVYAACVEFGTAAGISPAALPVTVLQDPFVLNTTARTNTLVRITVSEGDLSWRTKPYKVCAAPPNTQCEFVATAANAVCEESRSKNSPFVDLDILSLYIRFGLNAYSVIYCFIASEASFKDRSYSWWYNVRGPLPPDDDKTMDPESKKLSAIVIVGIVIAVLAFVVIVVLAVCCTLCWRRRRRRQRQQEQKKEKARAYAAMFRTSSRTETVWIFRNSQTTNGSQTEDRAGSLYSNASARSASNTFDWQMMKSGVLSRETEMKGIPAPPHHPTIPHYVPANEELYNADGHRLEVGSFQGEVAREQERGPKGRTAERYPSGTRASNDACRDHGIPLQARPPADHHLEDAATTVCRPSEVRRCRR